MSIAPWIVQDEDPYVRKTAAVCVAKLFDISPELVDDRGFLDMLRVSVWLECCSSSGSAATEGMISGLEQQMFQQ